MSDNSEMTYRFSPRAEAHAMNWDDLMPPLHRAIRDLLIRIEGAAAKMDQELKETKTLTAEEQVAANCFLIYGDRGTGKTTVLLSARRAVSDTESFFKDNPKKIDYQEQDAGKLKEDAMKIADRMEGRSVVWLDVLDLEPLPSETNLLTTMLTRVHTALDTAGREEKVAEPTSILEEGATGARHQLKQLINDAALVWENIHEQDTRSRANRQVAAADIYAQYRRRFKKAMFTLSKEIGWHRGNRDTCHPMILPIDNIDRSTEHLYKVIKLAQIVACPYLWLVMAGDRQDVDTFLERAYWKELIRIGDTAGGTGKIGASGEDEALIMARRQAAAATHKLLPPSHRIKVELVKPSETLAFKPSGASDEYGTNINIRELLGKVSLTPKKVAKDKSWPEIKMIHLFDMQSFMKDVLNLKDRKTCLIDAAEFGLRLPMRGVLDLWELAYWVTADPRFPERKAEKIARTMLWNVVTESTLPSKTGRRLLEQIIRRNSRGGTTLDYWHTRNPLKVNPLSTLYLDFQLTPVAADGAVRSRIVVNEFKSMFLKLWDEQLPNLVAAWLTILHDTLVWGAEDAVVINCPEICPPAIVTCMHDVVFYNEKNEAHQIGKLDWREPGEWTVLPSQWTVPRWHSFIAHNAFGTLWCRFLSDLDKAGFLDQANENNYLSRLLATGWIACVLETFMIFAREKKFEWKKEESYPKRILTNLINTIKNNTGALATIKNAETDVMRVAANVYEQLPKSSGKGKVYQSDEVTWPMKDWLEIQLPLLFSQWLVPTAESDTMGQASAITDFLENDKDTELVKYWKKNSLFILTDIEQKWATLYPPAAKKVDFKPFGPFEEILRSWIKADRTQN